MKFSLLSLALSFLIHASVFAQVVNPFETNRNEFNQKDFISVIDVPNEALKQRIYGYDWVQALNINSFANIVPLSDLDVAGDNAGGYVVIETANFNGDGKDDIFYLVEDNNAWTYGATYQMEQLNESDSLFHFINPHMPDMVAGAPTGSSGHSWPCVASGDFNGDGIEEIAVVWAANDEIHIQIVAVSEGGDGLVATPLPSYTDNEVSLRINGNHAISMTVADLNDDGNDEIIVSAAESSSISGVQYNAFLKVYDVGEGDDFTLTPKGRVAYDQSHFAEDDDISEGQLSAGRTAIHGVRSYTTTDNEGAESIFAAVVLDRANEFDDFDYLYAYHITSSEDLNTLTVHPGPILANNEGSRYDYALPCEAHRGDINGDAQDDIVLLTSAYVIFSFDDGELYVASNSGVGPVMDLDPMVESNDLFDVGDVNRDGLDDIISQTKTFSESPFGHRYWLQVYASDADFNLQDAGSTDFIIESGNTYANYGFGVGNLDGNDLRLGEPVTLTCDYHKPIIILEAIPNHFDILIEVTYDINNCYDFDNPGNCANLVSFQNDNQSLESQSVQVSSDWSVSSEISAGFDYAGFGMSGALGYKYGEQFSNTSTSSESVTITTTSNAIRDDFLRVRRFPFVMQEYPVLGPVGDTLTYIVAAFPNPYEEIEPDNGNSRTFYNYIPNHEIGNILSYPKPDDPDLYYDMSEDPGSLIHVFGNQTINTGVTETISLGSEASEALEQSGTTSQTLSSSIGPSGFGLGSTLSGEYTESETRVFGQTLSSADVYTIAPGQVIGGTNTWEYDIYPVLYWTREKAIKLAIGVDLSEAGANWQLLYGQSPDPALNLPYRYESEYNSQYQQDILDRTKSVYFDKFNPNPGDTVRAYVRVFNYSLLAMDAPVQFSMYNGHPDQGGTIIADIDGNTLFDTGENLEDQGRATVPVSFVVTNEMIAGEVSKIYVELDPNDEVAEIHESNNLGWANLGLACNTPGGTVGIGDIELAEGQLMFRVFPNPSSHTVSIDFSSSVEYLDRNLQLVLLDLTGKVIIQERFTSDATGLYTFDVSDLPSGMYIYRLVNGVENVYSGKLVVR